MSHESPFQGFGNLSGTTESLLSDTETLNYLIDHLFFPPRIDTSKPVEFEIGTSNPELKLLTFVHKVASHSGFLANAILAPESMKHLIKMLEAMAKLQALQPGSGQLRSGLIEAFESMQEGGTYKRLSCVIADPECTADDLSKIL